jgi:hypothetical protein
MTQSERRRNPYPWTWEIPGAITADLLVLPCLAAQTGRSIANLSAGGGWDFPHGAQLFLSLPGLVAR